ncbi:MAG TPA: hypothetical protein VNA25_13590, partial [Phycisphaerae bacterium]|nr:hypothetical protein [Phycisphaerae bacterium]
GRYLALTRFPREDRYPRPGEVAEVVLVDLETGKRRTLAETVGWDTQLGAQVQWGADDTQLFFNEIDPHDWRPFGVRLDPFSGVRKELEGTVYMVSPDGKWAASPCLLRIGATQAGYGVVTPPGRAPKNRGAPADDGVYVTNTETGECRLLISLKQIVETARPHLDPRRYRWGSFYVFHVKWNPQGDRLMLVLRWLRGRWRFKQRRYHLITMKTDGSDVRVAVTAEQWARGSHHPNWCPDGESILMNMNLPGDDVRFVRVRYDGTDLRALTDAVLGSGHPTLHPNGRHVLTDAYQAEPAAFGDGTVPIRLIDIENGREETLVRINTAPPLTNPMGKLRVDPHPAWDRSFSAIAFNACPDGTRKVYVADLTDKLQPGQTPSDPPAR